MTAVTRRSFLKVAAAKTVPRPDLDQRELLSHPGGHHGRAVSRPVLFDSFTMSKRRRDGALHGHAQRERILLPG